MTELNRRIAERLGYGVAWVEHENAYMFHEPNPQPDGRGWWKVRFATAEEAEQAWKFAPNYQGDLNVVLDVLPVNVQLEVWKHKSGHGQAMIHTLERGTVAFTNGTTPQHAAAEALYEYLQWMDKTKEQA